MAFWYGASFRTRDGLGHAVAKMSLAAASQSEEKMDEERTDKTGILGAPAGLARASEKEGTAGSTGAVLGQVEERGAGAVAVVSEGTIEAAKRVEREIRAGTGK